MTEAEWLAATDPAPMLEFLRGKVSERKSRLFLCGCCRCGWLQLVDGPWKKAVEAAEKYVDGNIDQTELHRIGIDVSGIYNEVAGYTTNDGLWSEQNEFLMQTDVASVLSSNAQGFPVDIH